MHTNGKWLVRGGALLVILGFFMPSMLVSCTVMPTASQAVSLSQLAGPSLGIQGQPFLYFVLLGALAAIVFAFLPANRPGQQIQFIFFQILGLGLGALSILVTFISLSTQMQQTGFSVNPAIGFYVLFMGYGAATIGIVMQFQENAKMGIRPSLRVAGSGSPRSGTHRAQIPPPGPHLERVKGELSVPFISINDGFVIGRSSNANLPLTDRRVSAQHARFRNAQGSWFIQDQNSINGIFVNGQKVGATRLNSGDQIEIGDTTFIFRI